MDWIPLVRRGLPAASVEAISRLTRTAQSELAHALAIPERTLARRKREGLLSAEESAKFVRFARVVERAEEVFEDGPPALAWLKTGNPALGDVTPLPLLDVKIAPSGAVFVFRPAIKEALPACVHAARAQFSITSPG
ncbi:antitoxin Xre-like helix-turn-helix domain-containing protein [Polaromonas sp. DSR2-3-2]|uniref:antitoxin Xre-like helix-turn-helix domain-containing protein n=1 Tax=unclassified Polaromonas TaxID=2638319 RepID=UPI003CF261E5